MQQKNRLQTVELLTFGFFVGKELLQVIVAILSIYFIAKRYWPELAMILIGSVGAAVIWSYLIHIFNRRQTSGTSGDCGQ